MHDCCFSSLLKTPFLGHPGLAGHGLSCEQLRQVQRFWPLKFVRDSSALCEPGHVALGNSSGEPVDPCEEQALSGGGSRQVSGSQPASAEAIARDCSSLGEEAGTGVLRTLDMAGDTIGFFLAKFVKTTA